MVSEEGAPPHCIFTIGTEVDGINFTGAGKSKKDAKKVCAMEVLMKVYNVVYPGIH